MRDDEFMRVREEVLQSIHNTDRNILEKWCKDIGYDEPIAYRNYHYNSTMLIYTRKPGILIGYKGKNVELLKNALTKEYGKDYGVSFKEIDGTFINLNCSKE